MTKSKQVVSTEEKPNRLRRLDWLQEYLGGRSRVSIYRDIKAGRLPQPVRIGASLFFHENEVEAAIAAAPRGTGSAAFQKNKAEGAGA